MGRSTDLRSQLQRVVNAHHNAQKNIAKGAKKKKNVPELGLPRDHMCKQASSMFQFHVSAGSAAGE